MPLKSIHQLVADIQEEGGLYEALVWQGLPIESYALDNEALARLQSAVEVVKNAVAEMEELKEDLAGEAVDA